MDAQTKAVLFNAVPLFLLAVLYGAVGVALAPGIWRERRRLLEVGYASAILYPVIGSASAVVAVEVVAERRPLAGHLWISLAAIVLAALPAAALLARWRDLPLLVLGGTRAREAERQVDLRDREVGAMGRLARLLLEEDDPAAIGRILADEVAVLFELDIANLSLIEDGGRRARLVSARVHGRDEERIRGQVLELEHEQTGIATVVRDGAPIAVFDVASSPIVSRRLNEIAKVASCAYVPLIASDRVIGVLFVGVRRPRLFAEEELARIQAFASEAGLALARAGSAAELAEALERERLISRIAGDVRSREGLDEILRVAVEETARAIGVIRCFIRLDDPNTILAQWTAPGFDSVGDASDFPVTNLAAREGATQAIADVREDDRLREPGLGEPALLRRSTKAALATPIVAYGRRIGVLSLHREEPGPWLPGEIALAESVAREVAGAIHTASLLRDQERRLAEQAALLKAGEALTTDVRFEIVIARVVREMCSVLGADAADCWTLLPDDEELVCRAVLGLPEAEVGRIIRVEGSVGTALRTAQPVLSRDFAHEDPPPTESYAGFVEVMDAPIFSFGQVRGVLGVCSREPGRFSESDLPLLEAFASLASIALRNAEAYEERARQTRVERGFYRIAAVLSEPLSATATLDAVAQAATDALGGSFAAVLRSDGGTLALAGEHELPIELATHLRGSAEVDLVGASHAPRVLASRVLREDSRFGSTFLAAADAAGARSLLAVPLAQPRSESNGLVLVFFRDERAFTDEQLELAGHVAGAARGALERSELYELERRSRSLAQRLARSSSELASELDPDNVLDQVVQRAVDLLDVPAASARIFEGDELVLRSALGVGASDVLETRSPSTAWLVGDIVQSRASRAIADVGDDPRAAEADPMVAAGHVSYLGAPMIRPDGSVLGVLAVYDLHRREWRDEEGEALGALAASAAAARSNADLYQGVKHEQQRSEAILANVADGIVAIDRESKVVLWNPAAEQITGVRAEDALGRRTEEVLGLPLEAEDDVSGSRLVAIRRAGSDEAWLSLSEAVMTDPAGAVAGRIFAFRDISSERAVEQMKSDFVSTVSHELRTPLTSIYGFAETLLRQDVLFGEAERETFLRYIASESERLTAIVDRLLSVAQLDTGAMRVDVGTTDIARIVAESVHAAEDALGENGHRFVVELEDDSLAAEADADKLGQVLSHLLDNAVRYSPAGGVVTVAARRRDDSVEIRVEDEGEGIPRVEQERIFRKFYRGEAASRTVGAGAAGLGLFLAEGLVTAMGGRIWVDSEEGRGARFVFELPTLAVSE